MFRGLAALLVLLVQLPRGSLAVEGPLPPGAVAKPVGPKPEDPPLVAPPPVFGPQDVFELQAFLDGVIQTTMDDKHIQGAAVAVVRDGKLFFSKGYGFADASRLAPVNPQTTMFRIASITKAFTFTAVMQLLEQGKIDLNADVNHYLDFRIPLTFPQPITMHHLLTHSAGFEERGEKSAASSPDKLLDPREYLIRNMPARVRAPGLIYAYSNYGAALAGHAVEIVSGTPFGDYLAQRILEPLGMRHSTANQPLPASLEGFMSRGFRYADGAFEPQDFELINDAPAGAMSASADDMGRFMLAQLEGGCLEGRCILQKETVVRLQARHFSLDPRLNGWAYGLLEMSRNDRRVVGHDGALRCFHSLMALIPGERLGLFVAGNTDTASELGWIVYRQFMEHYYPSPPRALAPRLDSQALSRRFAGDYLPLRRNYTTWEKAAGLLGSLQLAVENDGTVVLREGARARRFVEIEPMLFLQQTGSDRLILRENERGEPRYALVESDAYEKLRLHETPAVHQLLHLVCALFFASALFSALVNFLVNLEKKVVFVQPSGARAARLALGLFALLAFVYLFTFLLVVAMVRSGAIALESGQSAALPFLMGLASVLGFLVVLPVCLALLAWSKGYWGLLGRLHYTLVALAAVAFVWSLNFWHLQSYL